jgi:hypothetical protein
LKDLPRLPVGALKNIDRIEKEARQAVAVNVRPYTPGNPRFRRTVPSLLEGGYRAIEYICGYAEVVFDANAAEYLKLGPKAILSSAILKEWVAPLVERRTSNLWGGWLLATGTISPPEILRKSHVVSKPNDWVFKPSLELARQGVVEVRLSVSEGAADSRLAKILAELQERCFYQVSELLKERVIYWESEARKTNEDLRSPVSPTEVDAIAGSEVARRLGLLEGYKSATGNPPNKRIYEARNSGIHKPEFYKWLSGALPAHSKTSIKFELFLSRKKPAIPKTPRP